jgi:hypothetical protein
MERTANMINATLRFLWFLLVALLFLSCSSPTSANEPDKSSWELQTEQQATARSLTFFPDTGVTVSRPARLIKVEAVDLPLLTNFAGEWCWESMINVELIMVTKVPLDSTDSKKRTFRVLLDPESGNMISAASVLVDGYPEQKDIMPAGGPTELIEKMRGFGENVYGFAEETSAMIGFVEALNFVMGSPYGAKEIHVWCVEYARFDHSVDTYEDSKPVYMIFLRGLPPIPNMGVPIGSNGEPHPNPPSITDLRSVVDAHTGVCICATTDMP